MNYQSILIITYGRSGSTLLQGIFNGIDGCLIRGENYNFCFGLFQSYQKLLQAKRKRNSETPQLPWFGAKFLDDGLFLDRTREMVRDLLLADEKSNQDITCYGFKEIRYTGMSESDFFGYLSFLAKIMPNPALVFNTRDLQDVIKSGWWVKCDPEHAIKELEETDRRFRLYAERHDNCFLIDYSDVVSKSEKLASLFEFLGVPYVEGKVSEILSLPHSYDPNQSSIKELFESDSDA
jgi:hypothetical protein